MLTMRSRLTLGATLAATLFCAPGRTEAQEPMGPPSPMDTARTEPTEQAPQRTVIVLRSTIAPQVSSVREVLELGRVVRLDDGTTWEVRLEDRARSDGWMPGDQVRIRPLPAPGDRSFDVQLQNLTSDWSVAVRGTGTGS